jgi:hypothetical protein
MGRHHMLSVPRVQEHGRAEEGKTEGAQETIAVSIPATKSSTARAATILIPVPSYVEAGEVQGELSSSRS